MPRVVLLDTGPLVAWLDRGDRDHARSRKFFERFDGRLLTGWAVLTEVCHLVPARLAPALLRWVHAGAVELADPPQSALEPIAAMMEKYGDLPMDLADASLLWIAQSRGVREIATLDDTDFGIYRLPQGRRLRNVLA